MSNSSSFDLRISQYQQRVNNTLEKKLPSVNDHQPYKLAEAIKYVVLGGAGKRIRPVMVYAAGETMNVELDSLDNIACAVEMIHAYSLIHDDLPSMDDDDLRRGQPTCHRAYDEATAILAGDALQALAFEVIASDTNSDISSEQKCSMIQLLAQSSGAEGMAGGQAYDLSVVGKTIGINELENMHQLKTGALIRASILLGAMCSKMISEKEMNILDAYSKCIGLSFQIRDDILDVTSDSKTLGKLAGSDEKRKKPTYPSVIGVKESSAKAIAQHETALQILEPLGQRADVLRELSEYIVKREF